jgi:hypothetical protein
VRIVSPNSSTNSAWDRTQYAGATGSSRKLILGLVAAALAVAGTAGLVLFLLRARPVEHVTGTEPPVPSLSAAPPPSAPPEATVAAVQPPVATIATVAPPATVARPAATPSTAKVVPVTAPVTPHARPDAGIIALPLIDAGAPSTQKGFVLPTSRN